MRFEQHHGTVIVAITDPLLCAWIAHALRCAGIATTIVVDLAELFEELAGEPMHGGTALIIDDRFGGVTSEHLLAAIRTAGSRVPALVVAPWFRPALISRMRALAPIEMVDDPLDGAALCAAVRRLVAPWPARRSVASASAR